MPGAQGAGCGEQKKEQPECGQGPALLTSKGHPSPSLWAVSRESGPECVALRVPTAQVGGRWERGENNMKTEQQRTSAAQQRCNRAAEDPGRFGRPRQQQYAQ